jgi:uncharacterized membrane protein
MPSVTVWLYPTAFGAETGEAHLTALVERGALVVHDAVAVSWVPSDPEPRVRHLGHLTARAAGRGAMWGAAVGLLLLNPVAGAAVGAAAGAGAQRLRDAGISDDLVAEVREAVKPGTSALFVMSSGADATQVAPVIERSEGVLIHAELSEEGQAVLEQLGRSLPDDTA